jgi:hypothetical protein
LAQIDNSETLAPDWDQWIFPYLVTPGGTNAYWVDTSNRAARLWAIGREPPPMPTMVETELIPAQSVVAGGEIRRDQARAFVRSM